MLLYEYRNSGPADSDSAKVVWPGEFLYFFRTDWIKLCTVFFADVWKTRVVFSQMFMGTAA